MSFTSYHFNQQQPTAPGPVAHQQNHHGRNRRAPRLSVSQNSQRQFRGVKSVKEMNEAVTVNSFRTQFEASRSFDLEDDMEFCPKLLTESDVSFAIVHATPLASILKPAVHEPRLTGLFLAARIHQQLLFRQVLFVKQLSQLFAHAAPSTGCVFLSQLHFASLRAPLSSQPAVEHEASPASRHPHSQRHPYHQPCQRPHHVQPATFGISCPDAAGSRPTLVDALDSLACCNASPPRELQA